MTFPNPFVIGSGPPGTNYKTIAKAYDAGWGGVVAKTVSLTDNPVNNVAPRYGQHRFSTDDHAKRGETIGFTNIELISDRPLEDWLEDFKRLKADYPDQMASSRRRRACCFVLAWFCVLASSSPLRISG